eukprot:scaffold7758_cov109-Isochrysis_galbana.AAC.1
MVQPPPPLFVARARCVGQHEGRLLLRLCEAAPWRTAGGAVAGGGGGAQGEHGARGYNHLVEPGELVRGGVGGRAVGSGRLATKAGVVNLGVRKLRALQVCEPRCRVCVATWRLVASRSSYANPRKPAHVPPRQHMCAQYTHTARVGTPLPLCARLSVRANNRAYM